ncbi:MAG: sigma-70 family RNA polymerase sigma factor [Bryobacteraceae bacterium]
MQRVPADENIAALLAAGHRTVAFEALLAAYQDKVFRLCYSMLGDRAQAEDAAQESFLRVWKAMERYRGESALGTWIFSITRNVCLTFLAKRAARRTAPIEEAGNAMPDRPNRQRDILRLVGQLPDNYRQIVMLFYMEERSYEEVARLLDLPIGTVKTYLHRARKQLATMVKEADRGVRRI